MNIEKQKAFEKALAEVINRFSMENESKTPDFILGQFCSTMLGVLAVAIQQRETWYGKDSRPSQPQPESEKECLCKEIGNALTLAGRLEITLPVLECPAHKSAPEKCDGSFCRECGPINCDPSRHTCNPPSKDPVEEKIEDLSRKWNLTYDGINWLRQLVALARKS